jgi:hypothetical protein
MTAEQKEANLIYNGLKEAAPIAAIVILAADIINSKKVNEDEN